jgi:hypothetical protein
MTRFAALITFGTAALFAATATIHSEPNDSSGSAPTKDKKFQEKVKAAAAAYILFGRVDDETRWAPELCRQPLPGQARFSRSSDETTHGQKLYSLFAKNRDAYMAAPGMAAPVGQVIVKQSWAPEEAKDVKAVPEITLGDFNPYAKRDGKVYKASKLVGLYIMMKLDPKTADTDEGWIYGTVTADGETVTSAGRVESCMKCHETKKDRLFGLRQFEKSDEGKK